jgi:hypothetical protein
MRTRAPEAFEVVRNAWPQCPSLLSPLRAGFSATDRPRAAQQLLWVRLSHARSLLEHFCPWRCWDWLIAALAPAARERGVEPTQATGEVLTKRGLSMDDQLAHSRPHAKAGSDLPKALS